MPSTSPTISGSCARSSPCPIPIARIVPANRPLYNRRNAFFESHGIMAMVGGLDRGRKEALVARIDDLSATYRELSAAYQASKGKAGIPLA